MTKVDEAQLEFDLDFENLEYENARSIKENLEKMLQEEGWQIFLRFITTRAALRERELYEMMPASIEDMVKFAAFRGGINELRLLPVLMEQMLTDLKEEIRRVQDQQAEEEE